MNKYLKSSIIGLSLLSITLVSAYTPSDTVLRTAENIQVKIMKLLDGKSETVKARIVEQLKNIKNKFQGKEDKEYIIQSVIDKISKPVVSTGSSLYEVINVADGDTIKINYNGIATSIRILGIDTPEKFVLRTGHEECYGKEASAYASSLMEGKKVRIEFDETQDKVDKYGRLLAHVFLEDGTYYEESAIMNGYGFRYVYKKATKYDNELLKAEQEAKIKNLGVWSKCEGKRISIEELAQKTKERVGDILGSTGDINTSTGSFPVNTSIVTPPVQNSSNFSCTVKKQYCTKMSSCEEAKFYLNSCGISSLDGNKDGVPCESLCK